MLKFRSFIQSFRLITILVFLSTASSGISSAAATTLPKDKLIIGVLGVMSGPAAQWGLVSRYCAEVTAEMYNEAGGIEIDGKKYQIQIVVKDTEMDTQKAISGAQELLDLGVKYVIGPNRDDTTEAIIPLLESHGALSVFYGLNPKLVRPPRTNTFFGMANPTVSAPAMIDYLIQEKKVKNYAMVSFYDRDSLQQRNAFEKVAREKGLKLQQLDVLDIEEASYSELKGAKKILEELIKNNPDFILFPGALPEHLSRLISISRNLGYQGTLGILTAMEPEQFKHSNDFSAGFLFLASSPPDEDLSDYKKSFVSRYIKYTGEWHEEAGTKAYALETILRVLQASGKDAIDDINVFKQHIPKFTTKDPFLNKQRELKFVGGKTLGHSRQLNVPVIINQMTKAGIETIFFGSIDN